MATSHTRPLPIILSREEFQRLDDLARQQDRDPVQQARFMLRQAIREVTPPGETKPERDAVPA